MLEQKPPINTCKKRGVLSRCRHNGLLQFSISQTRVNFKRMAGNRAKDNFQKIPETMYVHGTSDLGTWYVESNDRPTSVHAGAHKQPKAAKERPT